jgi:hypothetical protein
VKRLKPAIPKFSALPSNAERYVLCSIFAADRSVVMEIPSDVAGIFAQLGTDVGIDFYKMTGQETL